MSVTFQRVRDEDLPALVDLFQASFEGWPGIDVSVPPIDHLRWKLGAWPGSSYHYVGKDGDRIVAGQWNQIWRARVGDRELLACRGGDAAVHPAFRDRGIMTALRAHMLADMPDADFLFGATTHPAIARLYGREPRLHFAHPWWVLRRPFSLREAVSTFKLRPGRSPRKLARGLKALAAWRRSIPSDAHDFTPRTVERFDERIDAFWREACAPFDFAFVRSGDVLNWRYADDRAGDFTIRLAEDGSRLLGYAVQRVTGGVGYIADILALPGRLDVVEALARDAGDQLREAGVPLAECWLLANHPYVDAVRDAGFLGRRVRAAPTFKPVRVPESGLTFLCDRDAVVHLTIGDMDVV